MTQSIIIVIGVFKYIGAPTTFINMNVSTQFNMNIIEYITSQVSINYNTVHFNWRPIKILSHIIQLFS